MSTKKIYFMAPLANVDSSILNVSLEFGFKIKDIPIWDYCKFISELERTTPQSISQDLTRKFPGVLDCSKQKLYFIENSFDIKKIKNPITQEGILSSECQKFQSELIQNYLELTIKKMRLFKEGNIFIPFCYMYSIKDNNPHNLMTLIYSSSSHISHEKYSINDGKELTKLTEFINEIKLPFNYHFLQLAFDNFELSYKILERQLSFLSLMMSLETLFHPSEQGELRYRISRNVAALLGKKDIKNSKTIFTEVKELYDKRSKLVHSGNKIIVKESDLLLLRYYVRESIKEINNIGIDKDDLLELLNSRGFS